MLGELFHYFKKYGQEITRRHNCKYSILEFHSDLSGGLRGWRTTYPAGMEDVLIFSFIDISDAIKKFRKETESWQS